MNRLDTHQDAHGETGHEGPISVPIDGPDSGNVMKPTLMKSMALIVIIALIIGICTGTWISLNCHREPVRYRVYGKEEAEC